MPAPFLDRISGQHETDSILDSYLKPKRFYEKSKKQYRLLSNGALKLFIVPYDIIATSAPMNNISPKLKSYYATNLENIDEIEMFFSKTLDLETSCGFVYMVHDDAAVLHSEIEFLRNVERRIFSLILSDNTDKDSEIDEDVITSRIRKIVNISQDYGTGLLISDQFIEDADMIQLGLEDSYDINGEFDFVIVNLNKSLLDKRDDVIVDIILNILSKVRIGGFVCVPETTYNYIPGKRRGIEALMKSIKLRIEAPPYGIRAGVIASRPHL